jgi:hypothetical protein
MLLRGSLAGVGLFLLLALPGAAQQGFDLSVPWEGAKLGPVQHGPSVSVDGLKGQVVMVVSWSMISQPSLTSMPILIRLHRDLGNHGLTVIGAHSGELKVEELKNKVDTLGIKFPVTDGFFYKAGPLNLPHVYLFNHQGKCIFRGGPSDAERKVREAVGAAIVEQGEPSRSKPLAPIVDSLKRGQPPLSHIPRILPLLKSTDKITATEAQQLLDRITAAAARKLKEAERLKDSEPIDAFMLIEELPADLKGTPLAKDAIALVTELRKDKAVVQELKARPMLEGILKQDAALSKLAADRKVDVQDPDFKKQNAAALTSLRTAVQSLQKAHGMAKATREAIQIADKYGLQIMP